MKIYQPRAELRSYVRYYWALEGDEPFSVLTFPIGCPQIIFHKKSPLYDTVSLSVSDAGH